MKSRLLSRGEPLTREPYMRSVCAWLLTGALLLSVRCAYADAYGGSQ